MTMIAALSCPDPAIPDDATLIARARDLIPMLRARSAEATAERRVPSATIEDFRTAGFFRMLQPRRFGGFESSYAAFATVLEQVAQGCGASAWVLAKLGEHPWYVACFAAQAQDEIWGGDRDARISASFAPRPVTPVDGGYRVTGTWSFSSGCDHAQWIYLGMLTDRGPGFMLVPMTDLEIVDDWHSFGLQGTGSKTVTLADVFVPQHRTIGVMEMLTGTGPGGHVDRDNYLARAPLSLLAPYGTPSVSLGLAQRALDLVVAATGKEMLPGGIRMADQQIMQAEISSVSADLDMIRTLRNDRLERAVEDLRAGRPIAPARSMEGLRNLHVFAQRLNHLVLKLCSLSNSRWVLDSDPRQLILRDVIAASAHRTAFWDALLPYGRDLLGLPPQAA